MQRLVTASPLAREPPADYLEREVDENGHGEVFSTKTFLNHLELCHSVIGLPTDLGQQVDRKQDLHICVIDKLNNLCWYERGVAYV